MYDFRETDYVECSLNQFIKFLINGKYCSLCPSNMNPRSTWFRNRICLDDLKKYTLFDENDVVNSIKQYINEFRFYNCNKETGNKLKYYLIVD